MDKSIIFLMYCVIFFVVLWFGSFMTRKWARDSADFILAGREVSVVINTFGVAAIAFAGTMLTVSMSLSITFGTWAVIAYGLGYCFVGLALYGISMSGFIRSCGAQTLPEWLEMRYSPTVRTLVTIGTLLGLSGIMANNLASMGIIISSYATWPMGYTIAACFLLMMTISYFSGLWAVTLTDFIQMIIGLVAVPLLFIVVLGKYNGFSFLAANWPGPGHYLTSGIAGAQLPILSLKFPSMLTFFLLFAFFLVYGNNYYWLRIASCRSARAAKYSYVIGGCVIFLLSILLALAGNFAAAISPNLFQPIGQTPSTAAFGILVSAFPPFLAAFLMISVVAASISTGTTAHIGATSTAVRDIYQRLLRPKATPKELFVPSKVIMLAIGLFIWALSYYPGGPVYLFAFANSWLAPPSILLVLGITWRRFTSKAALIGISCGMVTMAVLTVLDLLKLWSIAPIMHPGVAGFIATLIPCVIFSFITQPKYYGTPAWNRDPGVGKRENIELTDFDLKVLNLLRFGHESMAEITDAFQTDSRFTNEVVERLDRGGYIKRRALWGSNFYKLDITEKGMKALTPLPEKEKELAVDGLKPLYLELLQLINESPKGLLKFVEKNELGSLEISSIAAHLVRKGYILERGLWRRNLVVTEKGRDVLKKHGKFLEITEKGRNVLPNIMDKQTSI